MEHDHAHKHGDNCLEELSKKYTEYIESHLDTLREKCAHINVCINVLLEKGNSLSVIGGYDLRLNKTCSLVYKNSYETFGNFTDKCTSVDREDIRDDIEQHLQHQINVLEWKNVKRCLDNKFGDTERSSYVDEICGLAHNKTQICSGTSAQAHNRVKNFFNDQLHHLTCTCRALKINETSSHVSIPILAAAVAGGVLLLLALFAIGFICYRRRKSQKRKAQAPSVIYVQAPGTESHPVYQEIYDDRTYPGYNKSSPVKPPNLPLRYVPSPHTSRTTHLAQQQEDADGYLEPAAVSLINRPKIAIPGATNPSYGAPPKYVENISADEDASYFEPIPSPVEDEDKGYDTLDRMKLGLDKSAAVKTADGAPSVPVPAKRIMKDTIQAESPYFLLEKDGDSRQESSVD
uniref:Uncharacterized protein n=3 Tax=Arion vulgaris TaxID=1028688 RepID=A0A0B6ZDC9_9EUPU